MCLYPFNLQSNGGCLYLQHTLLTNIHKFAMVSLQPEIKKEKKKLMDGWMDYQ